MATKSGMKSKIPVKNLRKELKTDTAGIAFRNSNPPNPMEIKDNKGKTKMVKKEMDVKNKMSSEVKQSKGGNAEKVTTKEKSALTKKVAKQRPAAQSVMRSTIETVSKEMVNHLKAEKLLDCKSSTELIDNVVNVISKNRDEINSKRKSGEKTETNPSLMVQPKMYVPHSGLMLKPPVKKSTVVFKPFNFHPNRPKLRRSRSEYDPDFERPVPENIPPQLKNKIIEENYTTHQKTKAAKSCTISKNKELSAMVENKVRKEISQVHLRKPLVPLRMSKNLPVENKSAKPLTLKSKPLRRTNTIHAFDSVVKKSADVQKKESLNSKRIKEKVKSECETPVTPENLMLPQLVVEDLEKHITPKKEVPHRGIVFRLHATKKVNEKKFNAFPNVD